MAGLGEISSIGIESNIEYYAPQRVEVESADKTARPQPDRQPALQQDSFEPTNAMQTSEYPADIRVVPFKQPDNQKHSDNRNYPDKNGANGNANNNDKTNLQAGNKQNDKIKKVVDELVKTDSLVRAHEEAHQAAGGSLVHGKSFGYTTGPDGKQYVISGDVQIDISPIDGDPRATVQKMQQVIRAAMAPSDPSPQDRNVVAVASSIAIKASAESNDNNSYNQSPKKIHIPLNPYEKTNTYPEKKTGKIIDQSISV